jgi:RHS repeat-associated protein
VEQPLRFQGQYEDPETGLYYNRHRYYDPDAGRYITQDPIGLLGGVNSYQFAPNSIVWADPTGLARGKGSKKRKCSPCCGKDPSSEARAFQGSGDYPGVDAFDNVVLKKGTILYSLHPPGTPPGFAVQNHTVIKAGGNSKTYHELTQVVPGVDKSTGLPRARRTELMAWRVMEDICVARGKANAQNPKTHGSGGATQYYVSASDAGKLKPGRIRPI